MFLVPRYDVFYIVDRLRSDNGGLGNSGSCPARSGGDGSGKTRCVMRSHRS